MTPETKQKITDKLKTFLNREPTEAEIINSQNDIRLMSWIRDDEIKEKDKRIKDLEEKVEKLEKK
jgi:uncharacterized protein YjgD (DUF1641 family)